MADKHPYISGTGGIVKAIQQFRNALPSKIEASVLKKLGIAPKNESYLINILKFLKVIDDQGVPTVEARNTFSQHDDAAFAKKLSEMMKSAYTDLFSLHGEKTWELDANALITYFRQSDQSSAVVGGRQTSTFQTLAALAGYGEVPNTKPATPQKAKATNTKAKAKTTSPTPVKVSPPEGEGTGNRRAQKDLGLTVRIEINLPVAGDQETYDRIFRSIKENLLNG